VTTKQSQATHGNQEYGSNGGIGIKIEKRSSKLRGKEIGDIINYIEKREEARE